jgi:alpha-beta hydrolase superfamily lysophospholipase
MVKLRDLSYIRIDRVEFPSAGGIVRGLHYYSDQAETCIVLCHGYSSAKHNLDPLAFHLAASGYAALAFDFLGHKLGASSGPLRNADDLVANAMDAVQCARTRRGVQHVILGGHSMGAATAIGATALLPEVQGLIVMATSADRSRQLTDDTMLSGLRNRSAYVDGVSPEAITVAMDAFTQKIGDVAPRPVLVIAGSRDALVSPSAVRRLFEKAHEPKTFELIDANHTDCAERARFAVTRWLAARGFPPAIT